MNRGPPPQDHPGDVTGIANGSSQLVSVDGIAHGSSQLVSVDGTANGSG